MKTQYAEIFRPGRKLKLAIAGVVLEGFLTGLNFLVLLRLLNLIFDGGIEFGDVLQSVVYLAIIYVLRLVLYAVAYTESQTGGAEVTRRIRISIGDKLKKIPLGIFTENRTGFYINAATSETADYEQILTHKLADIIKFAMNSVSAELDRRGLKSKLILQIHDELIVEGPESEEAEVRDVLEKCMTGAADLAVELTCDIHSGKTWYDLK